ncbi:MAG: family ATPase [Gammaproteobacteria bacterium]|jgi:MSHA biogenesis protein MshM|nr:family ATPase [Gammaproteobacteria bacterium]
MYLEHFKLKEFPFTLTPNTSFFCNLEGHQAVLNMLLVGVGNGEGFIKIIGEVGAGKTLLCRKFLNTLGGDVITAYIPNPDLTPSGIRKALALELGLEIPNRLDQHDLLDLITKKLLELTRSGKRVVLLVDEAQALPNESLEALRLLTNLETESKKLLQVILFAQPELDRRLEEPNLRQLKQRILFSHKLKPINRQDLNAYICHRLTMAGYTRGSLFDKKACDLLYQASQGIPRIINILCHKALMVAYGRGQGGVDPKSMQQAIIDSKEIVAWKHKTGFLIASTVLLLGITIGLKYHMLIALHP